MQTRLMRRDHRPTRMIKLIIQELLVQEVRVILDLAPTRLDDINALAKERDVAQTLPLCEGIGVQLVGVVGVAVLLPTDVLPVHFGVCRSMYLNSSNVQLRSDSDPIQPGAVRVLDAPYVRTSMR